MCVELFKPLKEKPYSSEYDATTGRFSTEI